jgi:hypothetical protein
VTLKAKRGRSPRGTPEQCEGYSQGISANVFAREATMKASFNFVNSMGERTIRLRMTGEFDVRSMTRFADEYRRVSNEYGGQSHLVLADMRGMAPIDASVAAIFGESIAYSRRHGVVRCAHLSDDTVQRLQAARIGRSISEYDDTTVDVVSIEEAESVLAEYRTVLVAAPRQSPPSILEFHDKAPA